MRKSISEHSRKFKTDEYQKRRYSLEFEKEIQSWFDKKENLIKFHSCESNILTISMKCDNGNHLIDILHPIGYPNIKNGFVIKEKFNDKLNPLKFIKDANIKVDKKNVSITTILSFLEKAFTEYINIYKKKSETKVIFSNDDNVEKWDYIDDTVNLAKISNKFDPKNVKLDTNDLFDISNTKIVKEISNTMIIKENSEMDCSDHSIFSEDDRPDKEEEFNIEANIIFHKPNFFKKSIDDQNFDNFVAKQFEFFDKINIDHDNAVQIKENDKIVNSTKDESEQKNIKSIENQSDDKSIENQSDDKSIEKQSDDKSIENQSDDKSIENQSDDKSIENQSDNKSIENQSDNKSIENQSDDKSIENQSDDKSIENQSDDKSIENQSDDKSIEKQSDDKSIENQSNDKSIENQSDDKSIENQSDDKSIENQSDDKSIENQSDNKSIENQSDNKSIEKQSDDKLIKSELELNDDFVEKQSDDKSIENELDSIDKKKPLTSYQIPLLKKKKPLINYQKYMKKRFPLPKKQSSLLNKKNPKILHNFIKLVVKKWKTGDSKSNDNSVKDESDDNSVKDESDDNSIVDESDDNSVVNESDDNSVVDESDDNLIYNTPDENMNDMVEHTLKSSIVNVSNDDSIIVPSKKQNNIAIINDKKLLQNDLTGIDNTDKISVYDVDDIHGLYLDLKPYIKSNEFPFDFKKIHDCAIKYQDMMEFGNSMQVKKSFGIDGSYFAIINELKQIYLYGLKNNFIVNLMNDNIYQWKICFSREFFEKDTKIYENLEKSNIEILLSFDSKLYPFYPPKLIIVHPRLLDNLHVKIATMEILQLDKWKSFYNVEKIISNFRYLVNNYGMIDSKSTTYDVLEYWLIDLSLFSGVKINSFIQENKIIENKILPINNKKYGLNGIGYGFSGQKSFDVISAQKIIEEKERQLLMCIKNITKRLTHIITKNIDVNSVKILEDSCFVPYIKTIFFGNSLNLLKNHNNFESYLNLFRIMTREYVKIFLIKDEENLNLYEIFSELNEDFKMYMEKNESNNSNQKESDLISNFMSFYRRLDKQIKEFVEKQNKKDTIISNIEEKYVLEMKEYTCTEGNHIDIESFNHISKNNKNNGNPRSIILKEILMMKKSIPIYFNSSVFHKFYPDNYQYHEFIICGPTNTPYDSGCFLFKMYCPKNYPDVPPEVITCTTGNGKVRFNPNLYEKGKVCLSILGTWSGAASESWMPGISTMLQVIVSIQSLVMIPYPYFNEPGNEKDYHTEEKQIKSVKYNDHIRLNTMKWAMIDQIKNPSKGFEDIIRKHFALKSDYIKTICQKWVNECIENNIDYNNTYKILCEELDKLK